MLPVVYQVLTDMHDEEYPVRSAAFSALVDVVLPLAEASKEAMNRLLLAVVMPGIKHGIKSHNPQTRRGFIKLLTSVETKVLANDSWQKQPLLFPDLCALLNPSDGEASFFLNIVHLQTHRRVRALVRLRKQLPSLSIADNSIVHILLHTSAAWCIRIYEKHRAGISQGVYCTAGYVSCTYYLVALLEFT